MSEILSGESEPIKSEKEVLWEQKRKEVNEVIDGLGKGIDENIKDDVASFMIHEFPTSGSCEGHPKEKGKKETEHGLPYPWIEVYVPEPKGWEKSKGKKREKLEAQWTRENLIQQQKMMDFLEEFYKSRETQFDARLTFENIGIFGGFRVKSFGAELIKILPDNEQKEKYILYKKEMDEFTEFLKKKFFEE